MKSKGRTLLLLASLLFFACGESGDSGDGANRAGEAGMVGEAGRAGEADMAGEAGIGGGAPCSGIGLDIQPVELPDGTVGVK